MKKLLIGLLVLSVFNVHAANKAKVSSIAVSTNDGDVKIAWLGNEADKSEVELLWESDGQESIYYGALCFNGKRSDAIKILKHLDDIDLIGDELSLQNFKYRGKDKFSYEVYGGTNGIVMQKNIISACD